MQKMMKRGQMDQMQEMLQMFMAQAAADDSTNWKGELAGAFGKTTKANITKDTFLYETGEIVGEGGEKLHQSSVSFSGVTYVGEPAPSKKKAEQFAAKQAFQDAYPEHFAKKAGPPAWMAEMLAGAKGGGKEGAGGGKKRKAEAVEEHPKTKLVHGLTVLFGRSLTKTDLAVSFQEFDGGQFQAMLEITEKGSKFVGEIKETKKLAEFAVFEAAFEGMKAELEPVLEEHQAKKKQKNKDALAALRERTAEKKEAKKAAAA
mmetsp:Transcript_149683/g.264229  ORF Transcript_149683/g.264229 Transcript_149683/m.264229 type:complete len:260 (-) Transcript_149683:59-838(-)